MFFKTCLHLITLYAIDIDKKKVHNIFFTILKIEPPLCSTLRNIWESVVFCDLKHSKLFRNKFQQLFMYLHINFYIWVVNERGQKSIFGTRALYHGHCTESSAHVLNVNNSSAGSYSLFLPLAWAPGPKCWDFFCIQVSEWMTKTWWNAIKISKVGERGFGKGSGIKIFRSIELNYPLI